MAESMDKIYGASIPSEFDLETDLGVLNHLRALLKVKDGGLLWTAQECKSLIWAARWQTARSKEWPGGHEGNPVVRKANIQVVSLALLCLVAWLRDVHFVAENPSSTLLHLLEPFYSTLRFCCGNLSAVKTWLGAFNADTPKPLHLWGTWPSLPQLARGNPEQTNKKACNPWQPMGHRRQIINDSLGGIHC